MEMFAGLVGILQYGTLPAVLVLLVLVVMMKQDLQRIHQRMDNLEGRLDYLDRQCVKKAELYQDISGWRGDIRRLEGKLDGLKDEFFYLKGRFDHESTKRTDS